MAVLSWMAVTLAFFLSAGNRVAAVDQNQLARIVDDIVNIYRPSYTDPTKHERRSPMFSLAVTIPFNHATNNYDTRQVFTTDPGDHVRNRILTCEVYSGTRVVAATLLKWPDVVSQCPGGLVPTVGQWSGVRGRCGRKLQGREATWANVQTYCPDAIRQGTADHAEYRTLQHFDTLVNNHNRDDLLLFYVLASPCVEKCTSETHTGRIIQSINRVHQWANYAVVFSEIFRPRVGPGNTDDERKGALQRLGASVCLDNIFRCDKQRNQMQCTSCSNRGEVANYCFHLAASSNLPSVPSD